VAMRKIPVPIRNLARFVQPVAYGAISKNTRLLTTEVHDEPPP